MYRAAAYPVVDFANQQDVYRKHVPAVSAVKSLIDTSAPSSSARLDEWRKRVAHDHRMRQALASDNDWQMRQPEKNYAQFRKPGASEFKDEFVPTPSAADQPSGETDLVKAPKPLLQIMRARKLVHPQNSHKETKSSAHAANSLKPLTGAERNRFDGKGGVDVHEHGRDIDSDSDSGCVDEHVEAEAEDNEEEE
jgi:hypothetical protein